MSERLREIKRDVKRDLERGEDRLRESQGFRER